MTIRNRVTRPDRTTAALAVWVVLVVGSHIAGRIVEAAGTRVFVETPPIMGDLSPRLNLFLVLPVVVAAGVIRWGPGFAERLPWRALLWSAAAAAAAWAVSLALVDGTAALTAPLRHGPDYLHSLQFVDAPGPFLETFTDRIAEYTIHVQGHPPGFLLLLWWMGRIGLGGAGWAAVLVIAGGAAAVPGVLLALREMAGEVRARAAAPFLVLAPAAIWLATSADALYLGMGAWGIALIVLATGRRDLLGDLQALGGGIVCGLGLHASYGLVPLGAVVLAVAIWRRRIRPLAFGSIGIAAVTAAFVVNGFWWLDGLAATQERYFAGLASRRPYAYFVFGNLGAFALTVGPAAAAGLVRLRHHGTGLLVAAGVVAVLAADLSGMSKGEVERIWLPFVPWVLVAAWPLVVGVRDRIDHHAARVWLAGQAVVALAIQTLVRTPW